MGQIPGYVLSSASVQCTTNNQHYIVLSTLHKCNVSYIKVLWNINPNANITVWNPESGMFELE